MIKLVKHSFYNEKNVKEKLAEFVLNTDIFSMGAQCSLFEKMFAEKQGSKNAVFVSSGSSANLVLIQALLNLGRLKKGDRVGVSALTWATNVMPIIQLGLTPVLLDCEMETLNVSENILRLAHESSPLKALFLTNVLGFCDDIQRISEYCALNDILFFEDNCESLGTEVFGKKLGSFGVAGTFSTFIAHHLSTIEGGMICTDDDSLHEMVLMVRAHGWSRNLSNQRRMDLQTEHNVDPFYAPYTFFDLAYNARPTEIQGYIGTQEIVHWDEIVKIREINFKKFHEAALLNPEIYPLNVGHIDVVSNFAMPLIFKTKEVCEKYKNKFLEAGVEMRPVIAGNIGRQLFYTKYFGSPELCPNADKIHECGFYFGNSPHLTNEEVLQLCDLIK